MAVTSKKPLKVAVVGATGAVGAQLLAILERRGFPVGELVPFASQRSAGKEVRFAGKSYACRVLEKGCFDGIDVAFFDASDAISKEWVPQAAESGTWVVDNSATFRLDDDIFLLVPEVNGHLLRDKLASKASFTARDRILTGPNCSTAGLVMALKPLHDKWHLERVVVSTYQSASGAGAAAVNELKEQVQAFLGGRPFEPKAFAHQIAFNCIPHIGGFNAEGYTSEEQKMLVESRKLLGLPELRFSATAVRVPTLNCHGESVNIEFRKPFDLEEARAALRAFPGVEVIDDPASKAYPMGLTSPGDAVPSGTGADPVYVGRLRRDPSVENGLNLWLVSDNLRKGAALNAVQIGEMLCGSVL